MILVVSQFRGLKSIIIRRIDTKLGKILPTRVDAFTNFTENIKIVCELIIQEKPKQIIIDDNKLGILFAKYFNEAVESKKYNFDVDDFGNISYL